MILRMRLSVYLIAFLTDGINAIWARGLVGVQVVDCRLEPVYAVDLVKVGYLWRGWS